MREVVENFVVESGTTSDARPIVRVEVLGEPIRYLKPAEARALASALNDAAAEVAYKLTQANEEGQ